MMTKKAEVSGQLEGGETDLVTARHRVRQLEHQLEDASDEVDQLEWKLDMSQRDMELQVGRAKKQAQADHRKELEARDELPIQK